MRQGEPEFKLGLRARRGYARQGCIKLDPANTTKVSGRLDEDPAIVVLVLVLVLVVVIAIENPSEQIDYEDDYEEDDEEDDEDDDEDDEEDGPVDAYGPTHLTR